MFISFLTTLIQAINDRIFSGLMEIKDFQGSTPEIKHFQGLENNLSKFKHFQALSRIV